MDPWGDRFAGAKVVASTLVQADSKSDSGIVELTALDVAVAICNTSPSLILVLKHLLDFDKLKAACKEALIQYPELAGRFHISSPSLSIDCNNAGFPLSAAEWPGGSAVMFPGVLGNFENFVAEWPSEITSPVVLDGMIGTTATMDTEAPLFKLRLTTLGDGGCVLAAAWHHSVMDGKHCCDALVSVARAYKGEMLGPGACARRALTAEGLAERVPDWDALKQTVLASLPPQDGESPPEMSYAEAWPQLWGKHDLLKRYWPLPPGLPKGPLALDNVLLHIPRKDLRTLREAINKEAAGPQVTDNDALFGILWVMAAILGGGPLPGQGVTPEVGMIAADYVNNGLPPGFLPPDFWGNTVVSQIVSANLGEEPVPERGYREAAAVAARATRAAILKKRAEGLAELAGMALTLTNEFAKAAMAEQMLLSGIVLRFVMSNWDRFAYQQVDFGQGPPVHSLAFYPLLLPILAQIVPQDDGKLAIMTIPAEGRAKITEAGFFEALAPNAEFL